MVRHRFGCVVGALLVMACAPRNGTTVEYEGENRDERCQARCAAEEHCNRSLPGWPCVRDHSLRLTEKCSDPVNCGNGTTCDPKTFTCVSTAVDRGGGL